MVPRHEVEMVDISDPPAGIIRRFRKAGHSRLLVRDGDPDDIIGVLKSRRFLDTGAAGPLDVRSV
jgi:putative hemolysin